MPAITFDRFEAGIDRRKGASVSDPNRLRNLKNAYVTTGWQVRKRPGTVLLTALTPGTIGLFASDGKLHTFQGAGAKITHGDPLLGTLRIDHPLATVTLPSKLTAAELFNGFPYVAAQYANGDIFHHYLDTDTAWQASTAYSLNAFVEPTAPNGYRYKVVTAGTSGASEPTFPEGVGLTVADGTVVWQCESKYVADSNCPHTASLTKSASKIWAPGKTSDVVRFSATNTPRDWTTAGDAGFLPTGLQANGDPKPHGVGRYRERLTVAMRDSTQTWLTDPDPAKNTLDDVVDLGTIYTRSFANVAQDLYMLADIGFRSISTLEITGNLQDIDIGSPIDDLVLADLATAVDPIAIYYRGGGQYWCHIGNGKVWVYTLSRVSKLAAWSFYEFPFTIDDMAELAGVLYLRSGDQVHRVDPSVAADNGSAFAVDILMPYLDLKKPGQRKQIIGVDVVCQGSCTLSFLHDARDPTLETTPVLISGDTRPGGLLPVELMATEVAPHIQSNDTQPFELNLLTLYYDVLGAL